MAARRGKSQAKRNGGGGGGMPGWAWLVIGLAIGVGLLLMKPDLIKPDLLKGGADGFFRASPRPDAPQAVDAKDDDAPIVPETAAPAKPADDAAPKEQDYDFYTLLPGNETPLSDRELNARANAEAADRQAPAQPDPATAAPANPDAADVATPPPAIDSTPATPKPSKPEPTPAVAQAPRDGARYLLQAGAFAASGDAEALKAKIAFLGLGARVESGQVKGKTVYRVRMGPYGTATELAEAKRKLAAGGLPAMAIRAQ